MKLEINIPTMIVFTMINYQVDNDKRSFILNQNDIYTILIFSNTRKMK